MSHVISIRIQKELKELMDKLSINWGEEIKRFIEKRAREELTIYATETRYPGFSKPSLEEAEKAITLGRKTRKLHTKKLEI